LINFTTIGGIGEIGMNMFCVESKNVSFFIDSGISFPKKDLGIEVIIPDFEKILEVFNKTDILVVTHGHEDHIGAIPYLLKHKNLKIYATKFTSRLIKKKCDSILGKKFKLNIKEVNFNEDLKIKDFKVKFLKVNHSIPDSSGLLIKHKLLNTLFFSDFRMGKYTKKSIDYVSKENIDILFSDSTSIGTDINNTEKSVVDNLDKYIKKAKSKIIVTLFSSNIFRINDVINLALKNKRKVFISGNNIKANLFIANDLGYIDNYDKIKKDKEIVNYKDKEILLICTGSQGEALSSMEKISLGYHKYLNIKQEDLVLFSSSKIPGNEKKIIDIMNKLSRKGAKIIEGEEKGIHISGHASRKELKNIIEKIKPKIFIPIHGEYIHLNDHLNLLRKNSFYTKDNSFILEPGFSLSFLNDKKYYIKERLEVSKKFLDSVTRYFLDSSVIKERDKISKKGLFFVLVRLNRKGEPLFFNIESVGCVNDEKFLKVKNSIENKLLKNYKKIKMFEKTFEKNASDIKNFIKREIRKRYQDKPEVFVKFLNF
jgi:ribonuclease J